MVTITTKTPEGKRMATLIKPVSKPEPIAAYEEITPSQAQLWLDDAARNRNVRYTKVEQYANAMRRGDWMRTSQGIAFNEKGELIDGQHRLHAIVLAEVTITMLVVRGVKATAQLVIDQGAVRKPHDQIMLREGFDVQPIHVAVAKSMIMSLGEGQGLAKRHAITADIQLLDKYFMKHRTAIYFAVGVFVSSRTKIKGVTIAPVFAPVARAYYTQDHSKLIRFITVVTTGLAESQEESAAVVLRNFLIMGRDKGLSTRHHGDRFTIYKKSEIALKAFIDGEVVKDLGRRTLDRELFLVPGEK